MLDSEDAAETTNTLDSVHKKLNKANTINENREERSQFWHEEDEDELFEVC